MANVATLNLQTLFSSLRALFIRDNLLERQQQLLIDGAAEDIAHFASSNSCRAIDVAALQQRILVLGNGWDLYVFAKDVPGAHIKALQTRLMQVGNRRDAYMFARDVYGADVVKLHAFAKAWRPTDSRKVHWDLKEQAHFDLLLSEYRHSMMQD